MSQSRLDEAILDFVAALQKKPDLASARNNLRLAMAMKGEYDRAINGAAATDRAAVLNNAGYAAMLRGDYTKAKDLLTQAMKAKGEYYAIAAANLEMTQNLTEQSKGESHDAGP
jgi:ATP/maltotriose-dependent transcriptional regulator MalT